MELNPPISCILAVKNGLIAVQSAHKNYVDSQKFCLRLIERTFVAKREGSYEHEPLACGPGCHLPN